MICVLLGPPGSGKGTQAELITRALGLPHISTGDLLRAEAAAGTPLGREVAPLLASGELVPDALMGRILERRLHAPDAAPGAILDGYPRTVPQARALDDHHAVDVVLRLEVDEATLLDRLRRRAAEERRADDNPTAIAERLAEYHERTEPVVDYYRTRGVPVLDIAGAGSVSEVHDRIVRALEQVRTDPAPG